VRWFARIVALLAASAAVAAQPAPRIEFNYDRQADEQCTSAQRTPIKLEWSRELRERLSEFSSLWESTGPAMVGAVTTLTKKPFLPPPTVRLTLCDVPSNSFDGVTVNMRYALRSFTATPVPLRYKVDTVFHEALHEFVARNMPRHTALLSEHSSEPPCVRNHLHLLALQKAVLLSTKDAASLEQVIRIDGQLPSGCYKRAWSLVNAGPDAYLQYVAELSR
jgi:hypothetical protein